jgi:hypothetical protein
MGLHPGLGAKLHRPTHGRFQKTAPSVLKLPSLTGPEPISSARSPPKGLDEDWAGVKPQGHRQGPGFRFQLLVSA